MLITVLKYLGVYMLSGVIVFTIGMIVALMMEKYGKKHLTLERMGKISHLAVTETIDEMDRFQLFDSTAIRIILWPVPGYYSIKYLRRVWFYMKNP